MLLGRLLGAPGAWESSLRERPGPESQTLAVLWGDRAAPAHFNVLSRGEGERGCEPACRE